MSSDPLIADIEAVINQIGDPCSVAHGSPTGLADMGLLERVECVRGHVRVALRLTSPSCYVVGYFKSEIIARISTLPGVTAVEVVCDLGLAWEPGMMSPQAQERRRVALERRGLRPMLGSVER